MFSKSVKMVYEWRQHGSGDGHVKPEVPVLRYLPRDLHPLVFRG